MIIHAGIDPSLKAICVNQSGRIDFKLGLKSITKIDFRSDIVPS